MLENTTYLDHNATTHLLPGTIEAMHQVDAYPSNASAVHAVGRQARKLIEDARHVIASKLGADSARIIFTASGTEANNLALKGIKDSVVAVSEIEHLSVLRNDVNALPIAVNSNGILDITALEALLKNASSPMLVSVMHANNETGVIQPIGEIATLVHQHNGLLHVDASQSVGKIPVNMTELGADLLTISGHKFGGPQGAAALIIRPCVPLSAQITGGGQESGFRAGTENVAAIIGLAEAVKRVGNTLVAMEKAKTLRDDLEASLTSYATNIVVYGQEVGRLPNTSYISMPGVSSETQLIHFDLQGIMVSAGSACSSGKVAESYVLKAMGAKGKEASEAIRVSLGINNTSQDTEKFIEAWKILYDRAATKIVTKKVA